MDNRPASIKFPKNFQPVGTSNTSRPFALATLSIASDVGMDRARPLTPFLKYGIAFSAQSAIIATESEGVTKAPAP